MQWSFAWGDDCVQTPSDGPRTAPQRPPARGTRRSATPAARHAASRRGALRSTGSARGSTAVSASAVRCLGPVSRGGDGPASARNSRTRVRARRIRCGGAEPALERRAAGDPPRRPGTPAPSHHSPHSGGGPSPVYTLSVSPSARRAARAKRAPTARPVARRLGSDYRVPGRAAQRLERALELQRRLAEELPEPHRGIPGGSPVTGRLPRTGFPRLPSPSGSPKERSTEGPGGRRPPASIGSPRRASDRDLGPQRR